ncbi:hypothetical protein VKT23_002945 [Stygiomarasmius scandens]|uniref:Carrier domain-containing protein n=1 Tax=Marasmiellus scandens TaxID=2682957 RepID=A0ABR1JVN3_9AGAR
MIQPQLPPLSASAVTLPLDYPQQCQATNDYQRVDVELVDVVLRSKLAQTYPSAPLPQVFVAAFCATVFRITGQDDGVVDLSVEGLESNITVHYSIDSDTTPNMLVLSVTNLPGLSDTTGEALNNLSSYHIFLSSGSTGNDKNPEKANFHSEWQLSQDGERASQARIHFANNLYDSSTIRMFADVYSRVLTAFTTNPYTAVSKLPLCGPGDMKQMKDWNNTYKKSLEFSSIGDMFRHWATKIPDSLAVENGDDSLSLTYRQLDQWSDALACWLIQQGYGGEKETIIGVWQSRSTLLVVTYLSCLKAGCAYMPIEMNLPSERVRAMLALSACPLVLGHGTPYEFPCKDSTRYIDLATPDMQDLLHSSTVSIPLPPVPSHRLSSIVFTSGSTGIPKAILIQHSCLLNFITSDHLPIKQGDRTAMITSIAFDVSSGEIWYPLARGATLVCHIHPYNAPFDVENLSSFLDEKAINSFQTPTAILKALAESGFFEKDLPSLRSVAMGGEAAFLSFLKPIQIAKPELHLCNKYGPSESTVTATTFVVPPNYNRESIPIGRPLANIGAYVVDGDLVPVPPSVSGELLLTGQSLARGYLQNEQLTSEKFIWLGENHCLGNLRAYRTGDIVRRLTTGELEFVRRVDDQVKLRGYRVELREIERALEQHPYVKSAVAVVCRRGEGDDRLVAYVTANPDCQSQGFSEAAKAHLGTLLPRYMIPSPILLVPSFPLSPTGKVDRKLMATPQFLDQLTSRDSKLRNDTKYSPEESAVLDIFSQALDLSSGAIGLEHNLFDIGGHSLIAIRIASAVRSRFGVSFSIQHLYNDATVAGVITSLKQCEPLEEIPIKRLSDEWQLYPASDAQTRMWLEEYMNPGLSRYNVGFQRKLTGNLDVDALKTAFVTLLHRHDALRTVFEMHDPVLMQRVVSINECIPIRFVDYECTFELSETEKKAHKFLIEEHARPFDLSKDIPARIAIVRLCPTVHFVSMIIHHIASDGWSKGLIDQDLTILYNAFITGQQPVLSHLPIRYRDYAVWQKQRVQDDLLTNQLEYWKARLYGARPLELFTDFARPEILSGKAAELPITVDATVVAGLRRLASKHRTSLYVVLLAAFRAAVFRSTGEEDGSIGMVNANRPRAELEGIVGFFVNTHAIRLVVGSDSSFEDMILQTRQVTIEALQHSDVPFDKVVAHLAPPRDLSRNPLAQLMFVLQDFSGIVTNESGRGLHGLTSEEIRNTTTRLDLSVHLFVNDDKLDGYLMYQSDLFSSETIRTFSHIFQRILEAGVQSPAVSLSKLALLESADLEKVLLWNGVETKTAQLQSSIGDRFREVAAMHRSCLAVADETTSLTYAMLDEQSDRLASWLVQQDFLPEAVVGVSIHRSVLLVVAYLGCLKAGLAYMPLDQSLPIDRMRSMIQQARCRLVLVSYECPIDEGVVTVNLSENTSIIHSTPIVQLPTVHVNQLSNVMFTSGSTGMPKGVALEHRGMLNLCAPETTNWPGKMKNALTTSIGFDPSGFQIFTTLLTGSELHCLPDHGILDVDEYKHFLIGSAIERCFMTPSVLSVLLESDGDWLEQSSLQHILLGGEKLVPSKVAECMRRLPHLQIASSYGPTEASVRSAYFPISPDTPVGRLSRIPIGRSLPNIQVHVVDQELAPVPAGVLGEIVVSGISLARGYLNQPSITAERFVQTPQGSLLGDQRLYHTGDLGFWTADGQLQFVGRKDTQLKVRGQRLEAGEVEAVIKQNSAVKSAAVVLVRTPASDELVAYIQLGADERVQEEGTLSLWENHYNEESSYGKLDDDVAGHDFARWVSMYTGEPIPVKEMQEWLNDTIAQITPQHTDRVLELGVGTGKIALNIVYRVASFVGTDLSSLVIDFMKAQIVRRGLSSRMSVIQAAAHEFDHVPKEGITLAIINSVAQYFPSTEYFMQVIAKILSVMSQGRIFIGDVRSFALIPYHDMERALATYDVDSPNEIRETLERYAAMQTELLFNPSFFFQLQERFQQIAHVEIKPKYMKHRNELSRYRYTVVLHVGSRPPMITPEKWIDYASGFDVDNLQSELRKTDNTTLGAANIPIADIQEVQKVLDTVKTPEFTTTSENVQNLRQKLSNALANAKTTPAFLLQIAREEGWHAILDFSLQEAPVPSLRAIFARNIDSQDCVGDFPLPHFTGPPHNTLSVRDSEFLAGILSSIEKQLHDVLPGYMVPSHLVKVDELPLNRSGKLDRKLLSSLEFFEQHVTTSSLPVTSEDLTDTERQVLAVFARALNRQADTINIRESLFNLGGHSLIATLIVASLRRDLGTNLSMASFFKNPTVKDVAALISSQKAPSSQEQAAAAAVAKSIAESVGANAVIKTRVESGGPTLFIFPEATGFASVYSSAFEHIPWKTVAFGDENWGRSDSQDSIQTIVSSLLPQIRKNQPRGPYFLSGWSLGGYLALEAAIQLEAAGESIGMVMMFDTSVYDTPTSNNVNVNVAERWRAELDPLLTIVDDKSLWLTQFARSNRLVDGYELRPECFKGRVVLVKAERGRDPGEEHAPSADAFNGWRRVLPQVEVIGIDSTHRGMFDKVNGPKMGGIIAGLLGESVLNGNGKAV